MYFYISFIAIVFWFPTMAYITEKMESLSSTLEFLQFLGLYSQYQITWPEPWQRVFNYLAFFNVDVRMMNLTCWKHLSFFELWCIQAFLPLLYPCLGTRPQRQLQQPAASNPLRQPVVCRRLRVLPLQ